jgi:lysine 2,3-aminomutase
VRKEAIMKARYFTRTDAISGIPRRMRDTLRKVTEKFRFRASDYYLSLIDFSDPKDPIARIIIPAQEELEDWGAFDASHEDRYTKVPGLQHKYPSTAVLLVSNVCGGFCRFCFRKRLFVHGNQEVVYDVSPGIEYIAAHTQITNVLLSGGDPLMLSTRRLEEVIRRLRQIPHVKIIRIGTKLPCFNPHRILDDPSFIGMIKRYSTPEKKIYIIVHFNHPRELTDEAVKAMALVSSAGAVTASQTPVIRGVNDDPETLAELLRRLSFVGVAPYYVFQCRPVKGNHSYALPIERTFEVFREAKRFVSGLAKRTRLVLSHETGKIEIVGKVGDLTIFKYHQAADPKDSSRIMIFRSNPEAYWLDEYDKEITADLSLTEVGLLESFGDQIPY